MTERNISINTPSATHLPSNLQSPKANDSPKTTDAPLVIESADDEPYTIKCICNYSGDDGNTIYCEKCDTWQHIECFYPGRVDDASREEFDHSCADCKPRSLDRRLATDHLKNQRQSKLANDTGDKKVKRTFSKSHKKPKPIELQENGLHEREGQRNGMPENQTSAKKSRSYRLPQSSHTQVKKSPPFVSRPDSNIHPPSPAYTPPDLPTNFQVHGYSDNFLTLYNQGHVQQTCNNSFASLSVSNSMTDWLRDQSRLYQDAGVREKQDVFLNLKVSVDTLKWPELRIERKENAFQDITLHWQYLITPVHLPQPGRIVELNGLVGFQKDYCNDVKNRWADSAHPRPFVFFHPRLPLCIDTREEGSIGRYVRRSCRPNTNLETFIANGTEYHFWLTSDRSLSTNEQITIPWDFRFPHQYRTRFLHLLNLGDDEITTFDGSDITDEEYEQITQTIHLVLSDHGGCACNLANECAFARFHRNYQQKTQLLANGVKSKKSRKSKQPQTSPKVVDHSISGRAASEGAQEQCDEDDIRSVSGSVRSKPQSRDLTPAHGISEIGCTSTELSDREKRKLAMLEDSFRKMEQGQPPRKKKRASDGTNSNSNPSVHQPAAQSIPKSRQRSVAAISPYTAQPSNAGRPRYADTDSSRRQSGSPTAVPSPSEILQPPTNKTWQCSAVYRPLPAGLVSKPLYRESSTQTDEPANAWWKDSRPKKRKSIMSLAKRLLQNRYRKDAENGEKDYFPARFGKSSSKSLVSPTNSELQPPEEKINPSDHSQASPSVEFSAGAEIDTPNAFVPTFPGSSEPPPWPRQSNSDHHSPDVVLAEKHKDLPIHAPCLLEPNGKPVNPVALYSSTVSSISTHGSISSITGISPPVGNSIGQQPSPMKMTKKLSLSDYKAARMKKIEPSATTQKHSTGNDIPFVKHVALKPLSAVDDIKASVILDEAAVVVPQMIEKSSVNTALAPDSSTEMMIGS